MDRKEELKACAIERLELAISAILNDWPETARQQIGFAEQARHEWDRILVDEHVPTED